MAPKSSSGTGSSSKGTGKASSHKAAAGGTTTKSSSSRGGNTTSSVNKVYKEFGGPMKLGGSYGLKIQDQNDYQETKAIAKALADSDRRNGARHDDGRALFKRQIMLESGPSGLWWEFPTPKVRNGFRIFPSTDLTPGVLSTQLDNEGRGFYPDKCYLTRVRVYSGSRPVLR
ncbi:hypothetical protein R1flu_023781 [Riccia fluitans]|uniref:Uncharacterized protein n=1 Tax=Riccia fluitans TaxID=41844 RepID=A0ABD1XTI2_9MARC